MFDDHVPQVFVSLADVHALDGLGCLTGVLVGQNKQTSATAAQSKGLWKGGHYQNLLYLVLNEWYILAADNVNDLNGKTIVLNS